MNKSEIEFANEQSNKMNDLIIRKAVMEELLAIQDATYMSTCLTVDECKGKQWMIARAIDAVKDTPTVDAVEVVRCKDCKQWMDFSNYKGWENRGFCFLHEATNSSDDFCSYGERKEVTK